MTVNTRQGKNEKNSLHLLNKSKKKEKTFLRHSVDASKNFSTLLMKSNPVKIKSKCLNDVMVKTKTEHIAKFIYKRDDITTGFARVEIDENTDRTYTEPDVSNPVGKSRWQIKMSKSLKTILPKANTFRAPPSEQIKKIFINETPFCRSFFNQGEEFPNSLEEILMKQWNFSAELVEQSRYFDGKYIFKINSIYCFFLILIK